MEEDFLGMFSSISVSIQITFVVSKKSYTAEHLFSKLWCGSFCCGLCLFDFLLISMVGLPGPHIHMYMF